MHFFSSINLTFNLTFKCIKMNLIKLFFFVSLSYTTCKYSVRDYFR